MAEPRSRTWRPGFDIDLRAVLSPLRRGRGDPAYRDGGPDGSVWLAVGTADGPATWRLVVDRSAGVVTGSAWGPGADRVLDRMPAALGDGDDPTGFDPTGLPPALARAWRRLGPRWRVPASGRVMEALVAAVLEQKVTGQQARRAWRGLLDRFGEPAAGPAPEGMRACPSAAVLGTIPSWEWHRLGAEPVRSATIVRAAKVADRLEECAGLTHEQARRRLTVLDGVGEWTAAEVAQRALGDPDAVSFGDYHLARHAVYAFTGATDGDDDRMRTLLVPWLGHRYRVQRLLEVCSVAPPRRGPRLATPDHRRI